MDETHAPNPDSYSAMAVAPSSGSLALTSVETTIEYAWASWSNLRSLAFRAWSRIAVSSSSAAWSVSVHLLGEKVGSPELIRRLPRPASARSLRILRYGEGPVESGILGRGGLRWSAVATCQVSPVLNCEPVGPPTVRNRCCGTWLSPPDPRRPSYRPLIESVEDIRLRGN